MARITAEIEGATLTRLRHYLINADGSTKKMGAFLEEIIVNALNDREKQIGESKGNDKALCSA